MKQTTKHRYTEKEVLQKMSYLCASAEYCKADILKKMARWEIVSNENANEDENDGGSSNEYKDLIGNEDKQTAIHQRIIEQLVADRFIDEERFAHAFVRDKFRYNRWGRNRIQQELRQKGIDRNIIEDALEEIPAEDNLETLKHLISVKRPSVKGRSEYEIKTKLIRFALGRGFSMDEILKVIDMDE